MVRVVICFAILVSAVSHRIQSQVTKSQAKLGSSCENLQNTFHTRVDGLQTLLDAHPGDATFSSATQARFTMRTLGVMRVLRSAKTCNWVVDGDSEDIERMRGIVGVMLEGNPCAAAARIELEAGTSEIDSTITMTAVHRALSVLASENCEVPQMPDDDSIPMDEADLDAQLGDAEQQAQERVDELVEASMDENSSAFVETSSNGVFGGVMRTLGVVLLFILLLLACAGTAAMIGMMIGGAFAVMVCAPSFDTYCGLGEVFVGLVGGGVLGLGGCAYSLTNTLLPRLQQQ